ncbi:MAG: aminomethyl-transferring glycine dehydrogenase [Pirellula sp.]
MNASTSPAPFIGRHIGPRDLEIQEMLSKLGYSSLDELSRRVIPERILDLSPLKLSEGVSEEAALEELRQIASRNRVLKSWIGAGYYNAHLPKVLQRNVLENPAWYTAYTPYQPEISQGRLEVLFYYQTMVCELTGLDIANASLLDEATAAGEAMAFALRNAKNGKRFLISKWCHPQTIEVVRTRARALGVQVIEFDETIGPDSWEGVFGVLAQYPTTDGKVICPRNWIAQAKQHSALVILATDLLALVLLESPGSLGADVAVGSSQRFGIPLGFGGPHAAFFATRDALKRTIPGRLVGQSIDRHGNPAYRLSLQTREQHIRREKATSNICTAQALLAILATLYACYHGPEGLREIALRTHRKTSRLYRALKAAGLSLRSDRFFDTLAIEVPGKAKSVIQAAERLGVNLRQIDQDTIGVSFDETTSDDDIATVARAFGIERIDTPDEGQPDEGKRIEDQLRSDTILSQEVFHRYRSETEMMRYVRALSDKDIALDRAMIPLGSCTMKLNAASELTPVTWPEFNSIHPLAPADQCAGYRIMIEQLEAMLCEATGYDEISLQPNAGSQGEYAGLLAIMQYHESRGEGDRNICLIPSSAHGTNPASAQMANMHVVVVACDSQGNVDLDDLDKKIQQYGSKIAAIMITYPSTHGVFEEGVTAICEKVHAVGGQVYIDGANLNALVGVARPGKFGGDVSHLNLHKTFCIPHGGGGPGVGPVAVKKHLAPFLPRDGVHALRLGPMVSAAAFGSASILPISWMYIRMMGAQGLRKATQVAILNANYVAWKLKDHYPILYTGNDGLIAHECIIDTRPMDRDAHVGVDDIAKRLIDYGFHAPTMSFPVAGTLMIEPTESESLQELDRFCRAMILIHGEYLNVRSGIWDANNNPLKNAPHTLQDVLRESPMGYSRQTAVTPDPQSTGMKYWPAVARIDNAYGDRNLVCACPPMSTYEPTNLSAGASAANAGNPP